MEIKWYTNDHCKTEYVKEPKKYSNFHQKSKTPKSRNLLICLLYFGRRTVGRRNEPASKSPVDYGHSGGEIEKCGETDGCNSPDFQCRSDQSGQSGFKSRANVDEFEVDLMVQKRNDNILKKLRTKNVEEVVPKQEKILVDESTQSSGASDHNSRFTYGYVVEISDPFFNTTHQYLLGRKLGKGGFSEVRFAKLLGHPDCPRVAMKIVDLKKPKAARIERQPYWEIELLKRLEHSQRVIKIFESKTIEDDVLFMVLELAGRNLEHVARMKITNRAGFTRFYFRCCVKCVYDIHLEDIIHCDIKPANFIKCGRTLKVIDFGCATPLGPLNEAIIRKKALGTTRFMSPEYLKEKIASKGLDIWSLGCILYWLSTGQKIFKDPKGDLRKVICNRPADLSAIKHNEVFDMLKQIFDHDRKKRPSCETLLQHPYLQADMSSSTGGHTEPNDISSKD